MLHVVLGVVSVMAATAAALLKWGFLGGTTMADYQRMKERLDDVEVEQQHEAQRQQEWRKEKGQKVSDLADEMIKLRSDGEWMRRDIDRLLSPRDHSTRSRRGE